MEPLHAIVLGAVQGLTEFLPISSSGHLIIFPHLLGWPEQPLVFDTTLHLGTAAALIIYFFKDLWKVTVGFFRDVWAYEDEISKFSPEGKMGVYIMLGSIPAGFIGLKFAEQIESIFRNVEYVALFLVLGSVLMLVAERLKKWKKAKKVGFKESFAIGLFQALALLPGISRSGSTISGGMIFGLNREEAARFSFLLSIPIVVLAGTYGLLTAFQSVKGLGPQVVLSGFFSSFVFGLAAIHFLLGFLRKYSLNAFIVYRIAVAIFLLTAVL